MYFSPALVAAFAGLVYGANTAGTTQTVLVAQNNGLTFTPNTVTAAAGSKVAFQFTNGNHTVTAGTLAQACAPGGAGFASGFVPVNNNPTNPPTIQGTQQGNAFVNNGQLNQGNGGNGGNGKNNKRSDFQVRGMNGIWGRAANGNPTFTVTVANTQPQPVYCNQQLHCQQGPMVMIINGNAAQLAQYQASAKQAKQNVIVNGVTGGTLTGNVQQNTNGNNGNANNGNAANQQAQQAAQQAQQAAQQQQQAAQQQQQQQAQQQAQQAAQQAKNNN